MADLTWTGTSGDLTASANWGGSTPAGGDTLRFLTGAQDVDTNVNQSGWNSNTIIVGPEYAGRIGTAAAPLVLGTGATVISNARSCRGFALQTSTGANVRIQSTRDLPDAFIYVSGTIAELNVIGRSQVTISGGTLTLARFLGAGVMATIAAGVTTKTVYVVNGASVKSYSNPDTLLDLVEAVYEHLRTTSGTTPIVNTAGQANKLIISGTLWTITKLNGKGGLIDGSQNSRGNTFTDIDILAGCIARLDNGNTNNVFTNNPNNYGGVLLVPSNITINNKLGGGGYGSSWGGGGSSAM